MQYDDLAVTDLMLDTQNPRHDPASGQREAIEALLSEGGDKLVRLAEDIATSGLSPIDTFLVMKAGSPSSYTVLEGNRRIAALKLLTNPDLAESNPRLRSRFRQLAKGARIPHTVRCAIAATREEAKHWLELRHTGERGGRGVVGWSAEAAQRFAGRRGTQADRALVFADAVQKAYPSNTDLQQDLASVRNARLTTLGRLVSDPSFRDRFAMRIEEGDVISHYPPASLEPVISRVVADLATKVTVTELKTKQQRRRYMGTVAALIPDSSLLMPDAVSLSRAGRKARAARTKTTKQIAAVGATKTGLFDGVELVNLGDRVAELLRELKHIEVDRYPNASAALVRVMVELAVFQVHALKKKPMPGKLKDGVKYCLTQVDPTGKDNKYQPVRTGLQDGTSLFAVSTIHAFLHNPYFRPTSDVVRGIAANFSPFLQALDSVV